MSQPLRAALNRRFRKTISSFGASDLEINIAVETDFTIALRDAIASTPALGEELYGRESLPMVFQYDPLNYFIESDENRNLLFTINRLENVSPRIRYNIRDRGVVRSAGQVAEVAARHGARLPGLQVDLPLLFHWGRQDNAVGFYGCKITPEDIQHVILRIDLLGERVTNFALHPYEDDDANKRVEIWFELANTGDLPDAGRAARRRLARARVGESGLSRIHQDGPGGPAPGGEGLRARAEPFSGAGHSAQAAVHPLGPLLQFSDTRPST